VHVAPQAIELCNHHRALCRAGPRQCGSEFGPQLGTTELATELANDEMDLGLFDEEFRRDLRIKACAARQVDFVCEALLGDHNIDLWKDYKATMKRRNAYIGRSNDWSAARMVDVFDATVLQQGQYWNDLRMQLLRPRRQS
jgi:hypothetical protein